MCNSRYVQTTYHILPCYQALIIENNPFLFYIMCTPQQHMCTKLKKVYILYY